MNQLKSKIDTLIYAIVFLCVRFTRRRHLHKLYIPFIILEISGPLSSSSSKIPFHRASEKIFDNVHYQLLAIFDTKEMRDLITNSAIPRFIFYISDEKMIL